VGESWVVCRRERSATNTVQEVNKLNRDITTVVLEAEARALSVRKLRFVQCVRIADKTCLG